MQVAYGSDTITQQSKGKHLIKAASYMFLLRTPLATDNAFGKIDICIFPEDGAA